MKFALNVLIVICIIVSQLPGRLLGSDPSDPNYPTVEFDLPPAVACRKIPSQSSRPGRILVECEIPLSVRVGHPSDKLRSIRAELVTFERAPAIIDFLPKEKLAAATDGGITITEGEDGRVSYGIGLQAEKDGVSANGRAEATNSRSSKREYTLPAPSVVVATSGTIERGACIWFKFERTAQHQLEKQHMMYVILEVDTAWRCDAVKYATQATATGGEICGENAFYLGLYLNGDEDAKNRASNLQLMQKYQSIIEGQRKVREIENYLSYPLLGYGSMAERERIRVRKLQSDFDQELANLRKFR
jgi:hypothetical protein